jgi:hypothetical protein
MTNPIFARIKRYLADSASRPSQVLYSGRWLEVSWDLWDDKYLSRGFRFRTGYAYDAFDAGDRGGGSVTLRVIEVVSSQNRLLDLQIEPINWDFW